jgi:large subunit ribosomal protein L14
MIQVGTFLTVVDNSGAKIVKCIHLCSGYRQRYAHLGDLVLVSVRCLRSHRRSSLKIKKGEVYFAVIVTTRARTKVYSMSSLIHLSNSVVLLSRQKKLLGTRVFGGVSHIFRYTKFLKLLSISSGTVL